jgi:hypothetical protein
MVDQSNDSLKPMTDAELTHIERVIEEYVNSVNGTDKDSTLDLQRLFTIANLERLVFSVRGARKELQEIAEFWTDTDKYPDGPWMMQDMAREYLEGIKP